MKRIIRSCSFNIFGLWLVTKLLPDLIVIEPWQIIVLSGVIVSVLYGVIKPLLKILFIPLNFITFGLSSWLIDVIVIYLLTIIAPQVVVNAGSIGAFTWEGFVIPAIHLSYFWSLVAISITLVCITNILHWASSD